VDPVPDRSIAQGSWWPEDRAWFVHTHFEATSAYLGGSRALVDQLVGEQLIESFEVQAETLVAW
jgi:hypothetical protein